MMPDPIYEARSEQHIASSSGPILHGFSRLGIGCAVLIAMIGVAVTATVVIDDYSRWVGGSSPPAGLVLDPPPISRFVHRVNRWRNHHYRLPPDSRFFPRIGLGYCWLRPRLTVASAAAHMCAEQTWAAACKGGRREVLG